MLDQICIDYAGYVSAVQWHVSASYPLHSPEGRLKWRMYPGPYNGGYATPWLWVDGRQRGYIYSQWPGFVSQRVTEPTPVSLGIFGSYDQGLRTGTVQAVIQNDSSAAITARVSVVITEDSLNYTGPNGDPWHNHVCRDYVPDQNGTVVTIAAGAADTVELPFTIQSAWREEKCKLVVYAQSTTMLADSSYPAFQGGEENVMEMVGIEEAGRLMPELLGLSTVPSVSRGRTEFRFNVDAATPYSVDVYALDGSLVRELRGTATGATRVPCDLAGLARGVYVYRLAAGNAAASGKLILTD